MTFSTATDTPCDKCGALLQRATEGAYRGLLYCPRFCRQFECPSCLHASHRGEGTCETVGCTCAYKSSGVPRARAPHSARHRTVTAEWSADYVERIARDMLTVADAANAQYADGVMVDVDHLADLAAFTLDALRTLASVQTREKGVTDMSTPPP